MFSNKVLLQICQVMLKSACNSWYRLPASLNNFIVLTQWDGCQISVKNWFAQLFCCPRFSHSESLFQVAGITHSREFLIWTFSGAFAYQWLDEAFKRKCKQALPQTTNRTPHRNIRSLYVFLATKQLLLKTWHTANQFIFLHCSDL